MIGNRSQGCGIQLNIVILSSVNSFGQVTLTKSGIDFKLTSNQEQLELGNESPHHLFPLLTSC